MVHRTHVQGLTVTNIEEFALASRHYALQLMLRTTAASHRLTDYTADALTRSHQSRDVRQTGYDSGIFLLKYDIQCII